MMRSILRCSDLSFSVDVLPTTQLLLEGGLEAASRPWYSSLHRRGNFHAYQPGLSCGDNKEKLDRQGLIRGMQLPSVYDVWVREGKTCWRKTGDFCMSLRKRERVNSSSSWKLSTSGNMEMVGLLSLQEQVLR